MEYLVVRFTAIRRVMVDGRYIGRTGNLLELERGTHDVTLESPSNFHPAVRSILLEDTTESSPLEIIFEEC